MRELAEANRIRRPGKNQSSTIVQRSGGAQGSGGDVPKNEEGKQKSKFEELREELESLESQSKEEKLQER